jgi:plasmid stability protein
MPAKTTSKVFIGVSGIPLDLAHELRQRARTNNRSVSGEIRDIIEAALKEFPQGNTEQETNQ